MKLDAPAYRLGEAAELLGVPTKMVRLWTRKALPIAVVPPSVLEPPVAVGALVHRGQRFRCGPYSAVLSAGACVQRQELVAVEPKFSARFSACRSCPTGSEVLRRVGLTPGSENTRKP